MSAQSWSITVEVIRKTTVVYHGIVGESFEAAKAVAEKMARDTNAAEPINLTYPGSQGVEYEESITAIGGYPRE